MSRALKSHKGIHERLWGRSNADVTMLGGAGVIEEVMINRMGNYSCPVSVGVVFVANLAIPGCPGDAIERTVERTVKHFQVSLKIASH